MCGQPFILSPAPFEYPRITDKATKFLDYCQNIFSYRCLPPLIHHRIVHHHLGVL